MNTETSSDILRFFARLTPEERTRAIPDVCWWYDLEPADLAEILKPAERRPPTDGKSVEPAGARGGEAT